MGILRIVSTIPIIVSSGLLSVNRSGSFCWYNNIFSISYLKCRINPYHRWQSIRVAVLLAFAYFTLLHIFRGTKALYPIKFLEIFIKILTITGIVLFYRTDMIATDFGIILFFIGCSAILHISARPRLRKYFSRK